MIEERVFNKNQIDELKASIKNVKAEKIFIVRANNSYHTSGAETFINKLLETTGYTSFSDFAPNPQLSDLQKGVNLFREGNFDMIITIGGGSVIDMAKLISVFAHQKEDIENIVLGKSEMIDKKTPLIAIPTTAGTGAEATHFAVLYIDKKKYSVANSLILPDTVYLSAEFSQTASPYLTACTGLDAFCQAIESVWSVNANIISEEYALKAIELIWNNLKKAVTENEEAAKDKMQLAAYLAGKAINTTKTTAPHAISYAFTSYYSIPHGHAVALSLPYFLYYNYNLSEADCVDARGVLKVRGRIDKILNIFNIEIDEAVKALEDFFNSIGIRINIFNLIENFDPEIIVNNVNIERLSNNPRKVSKEGIISFLNNSKI